MFLITQGFLGLGIITQGYGEFLSDVFFVGAIGEFDQYPPYYAF